MSKVWHGVFQVIAIVIQIAVASSSLIPPAFQPIAITVIAALQAAVALYNHQTPAPPVTLASK